MRIRRLAAVFCAVMASFTIFSACGGGSSVPDGKTDSETETASEAVLEPPELEFNVESGFYESGFDLEIKCVNEDAVIYYTEDGSVPDKTGKLYTAPIPLQNKSSKPNVLSAQKGTSAGGDFIPRENVDKANVIRAVAFYSDGTSSEIISGTFFIGIDREGKYGNIPVVSLFTDMDNLYDYETGIYVLGKTYDDWLAQDKNNAKLEAWQKVGNYSNKGRKWERPVTVEYFDADGHSVFVQDMGMKIKGAASRNATQKSFCITARSDYGEKSVKYEIIPDNERSDRTGTVEKYKSFVLRNGGNDCDSAKIRDPFLQQLVADRRFDTEQYVPCIVYLDGEYWGMYTLAEEYSDNYIENNYGIDNNNVVVLKRGEIDEGNDEDIELYNEMFDFITEHDMSVPTNYEKASGMLDIGSYVDYCAFNLYIYNEDSIFKDNNWEMWRVRDADGMTEYSNGKWRMMVYDVDFSTGIYSGGSNYGQDNISEVVKRAPGRAAAGGDRKYRRPSDIFASLYANEEFRRELVLAMCDIRNINFEKISAQEKMKEVADVYSKIVPDTFRRFGPDWVANQDVDSYYSQKTRELASFIFGRYEAFPKIMRSAMGLDKMAKFDLSVSDGGSVRVNSSGVDITDKLSGIYFADYEITLTAIPNEGCSFVRWEYEGCTVSDANSEQITVSFDGDFKVTAVFEN